MSVPFMVKSGLSIVYSTQEPELQHVKEGFAGSGRKGVHAVKSLVIGQAFRDSTVVWSGLVWSGQAMREPVCETGHEPMLAAEEAAGIWSVWARSSLSFQRYSARC